MSRKLRIEYPGATYHLMNRGDQREDIFRDDQDRQKFLASQGEACAKTECQVAKGRLHTVSFSPSSEWLAGLSGWSFNCPQWSG
jgi:hypothetical protein